MFDKKLSVEEAKEISESLRRIQKDIDSLGQVLDKHDITFKESLYKDMQALQSSTVKVVKIVGFDEKFVAFAMLPMVRNAIIDLASELERNNSLLKIEVGNNGENPVDLGVER